MQSSIERFVPRWSRPSVTQPAPTLTPHNCRAVRIEA
jgi:hypothetical protein